MKTSVESLAKNPPIDDYNKPEFRNLIEDLLTWLINHPTTKPQVITGHQIDVYDFDWIGLLNSQNVVPDLHWITIRMNGGTSFTDVPENLRSILVPDINTIRNINMMNSSKKRIK